MCTRKQTRTAVTVSVAFRLGLDMCLPGAPELRYISQARHTPWRMSRSAVTRRSTSTSLRHSVVVRKTCCSPLPCLDEVSMRILQISLMVVFLASACNSCGLPRLTSSTAPEPVLPAVINVVPRPGINAGIWSSYSWPEWQSGAGEMLSLGRLVNATVDDQLCVLNLRTAGDAQASCLRFAVSVSSPGKLEAFLHWSTRLRCRIDSPRCAGLYIIRLGH